MLCFFLAAHLTGSAQAWWCNNNFDIPSEITTCANQSESVDWWTWYDDGNNDPDLLEALWISPSGDSTLLPIDVPFILNGSTESGTWDVVFDLSDQGGQPDDCDFQIDLTVFPTPDPDFSVVEDGICGSEGIEFDVNPVSGYEYEWNFGDGTTSSQTQPIHVYEFDGGGSQTVSASLTVTNDDGCSATSTQSITVLQNPNPGLDNLDPLCVNTETELLYTIQPFPVPLSNDGIVQWTIDWGNGQDTTTTNYNPFTDVFSTYYSDGYGFYDVNIVVTGANGCTSTVNDSVFVGNNPTVGASSLGSTVGLCSPAIVEVAITGYAANAPGTVYELNWGDGTTETLTQAELEGTTSYTVTHEYTSGSCGAPNPVFPNTNSFRFSVEADNACPVNQASGVDIIQVHTGPEPALSGPSEVCMNETFSYAIEGTGEIVTSESCTPSDSFWNITPLDGQTNVNPSSGSGVSFSTAFPEPGEYQISAVDVHPNCPNGNDQMIVCVYPELLAQGTASPSNGCAPLQVNLQDLSQNPALCGDPNTEWIISGPGHTWVVGGPNDVAPVVELTDAGTYTITLRVAIPDKQACPPDEQVFTIEVYEPPIVEVGSLTMICAGDELEMIISSLSDGGTPLTNWSWQLDGVEFSDVQGTVPLSFSEPGEYVVTGEATNLCGQDTSNINIEVDSIPEIDFELPDLPAYCAGDTMLVIATGAQSYTWSSSPVIVGDLHSHCVPIVPQSNVSLGLSANSANGCTNSATIDIEIAPLPSVNIASPPSPCPGESVTFTGTASGGSGTYSPFQWSGPSGAGSGSQYNWTAPAAASSVEVQLTVTDDVGCDNTATANLTSFDNPTVEAGDTLTLCNNDAVTEPLTGYTPGLTEGGTGTWSGPGLSGADSFTPNGVGIYDLTYTFTDANGCTASDDRAVVVEALTQVDPGLPVEACFGDAGFTMEDFSPASATWSGTGVSPDGTLDPSLSPGTYTLTIENGVLSCYTSDSKPFTIHPLPEPVITGTEEICEGDTAQLILSEPDGASLTWSFDAAAPTTLDTLAGVTDMTFTGLAVSAFGCESSTDRTVLVNPLPAVEAPLQDAFCNQSIPTSLQGGIPTGGDWSGPGVTDPNGTFLPSAVGTGQVTLTYTYIDPTTGCTNRDSVDVDVVEPEQAEAGPDLSVCDIDTAFALTDFSPVTGGTWSGSGVLDPGGNVDASPLAPGSYTLTYTFGSGTCESVDDRTLVVLPRPVIDLTADVAALCDGDSVFFSASVSAGLPPYTFEWSGVVPETQGVTTTAATGYAQAGTPLVATLTVTDANGCSETAQLEVTVWALPNVDAGVDVQFCNQSIPVQLSGFTPAGGDWSGPGITDPSGTFLPSSVGEGTFEVVYTVTDGNDCLNRDTAVVEVIEPQLADAGPDLSLCDIDTVFTLTDFSPVTASGWTGDGVAPDGTVTADPLTPGTYTLTYTIGTGTCLSTDTRQLEIRPLPALDLVATDATVCDGTAAEWTATISGSSPPYSWSWSDNVGGGSGTGTSTTAETVVNLAAGPTESALLTVEDATGCVNSLSTSIDILALPGVDGGGDTVFCNTGIAGQLEGFSPGLFESGTGLWEGLGGAAGALGTDGTFAPDLSGTGSFTAVYTYTEAATGCVNSDTILVDVTDPVTADAGPDTTVCDNAPLLQLEGYFPATNVTWSATGAGGAALLDASTGLIQPALLGPGDYSYLLEYGYGTCYTQDERVIHIDPLPVVTTSGSDLFCENEGTVVLASGAPVGGIWEGTGITDATGDFATGLPLTGPGTYPLEYWFEDPLTGCRDTAEHSVTVQPIPVVDAGLDTVFCNTGIAGQLEGFSPGLFESGTGLWEGLGGAAGALGTDGTFAPDLSGTGSFTAVYTYTEAATGCVNSDTILVDVTDPVTADAGPDTTVCDNAPLLQLEGYFPATNVTWSATGAGGAALLDASTGLIQPALLGPGDYSYLLEYGYGTCYTQDERVIHIDPLPVVTTSGSDLFCENEGTVVLASGAPVGGIWEGTGITDATGDFATGLPLTGPGTYPLEYWFEDPLTGCRDTAEHSVTVQPIPVVDAGLDTVFCNQPIAGSLLGFSPGLNDDGTGTWSGLGGLMGAIAPDGTVDPNLAGTGTFGAVYTYTAAATGCTHTDTLDLTIADPLVADAGPDTTVCDNAYPLQLVGFPLTDALWSGTSPEAQNGLQNEETGLILPGPMAPGTYTYLIEYGVGTCYTSDEVAVTIDPLPALDIASPDAFCANLGTVNLAAASPAGGTWFGPGILDADAGTFSSGLTPGDYTPAYTYEDPLTGCRDTLVHAVTVHPVPVAAFLADTLGCSNLDLPITNNSTGQSENNWDFGGVGSSTAITPAFTFPGDGTYLITLIAANAFGCQDTALQNVDITHPPVADFLLTPDSGCAPLDVEFANQSDAPYGTFLWNVNGDAYDGETPPSLNFTQGDSIVDYAVSLLASNLCGSDAFDDAIRVYPTPVVSFAFEEDTVCSPFDMDLINTSVGLPDDVQWDFGDGSAFSGYDPPNHWYTVDSVEQVYTLTLIGTNQCGSDTVTGDVLVLPNQVEAFFTLSTPDGCVPFNLTVDDFSTATTAVNYAFGNGDFAATPTASTTYTEAGTYTITQFVTNGCSYDTLQSQVTVHPLPEVELSVSQPNGCEEEAFTFTSVTDNPGNADWDFGDGTTGAGLTVDHSFDASGTFTVVFTTEAPLTGCLNEASLEVEVHPNPVAQIALDSPLGCAPLTVTFTNASSGSQFQTWHFGDGSEPGFQTVPTHVFENDGLDPVLYDVTLVAESPQLCLDSTTVTVTVLPTPVADFTLAEEESCSFPVDILVSNSSIGAINHNWTVNGDNATVATNPTFTADAVGSYSVELIATNSYACSDEAEAEFTVHLAPIANLSANPRVGCNPLSVDFLDLSSYSLATSLFIDGIYDGPLPTEGLVIDQVGTFESFIVATSPEGCTDTLTLAEDFKVHPIPVADFSYDPLTVSPENTSFQFSNESNTSVATHWNFGDGNGSFFPDPLHRYDEPGEYQVTLEVQNEFGCKDLTVDLLVIDDKISVFVPNAFTPASDGIGDGINDAFKPVIRGINLIQKYKFQIFDRWGTVIFETDDYDESWLGDVDRGDHDQFDYFAQNEVYNWKVTLILPGEEADEVPETANPFCNGPRQFCGHVTLVR